MTYSTLARGRRLRPRSDRAAAERDAADDLVQSVFLRDGGCLLRPLRPGYPGLFGHVCTGLPETPHHLHKAGQGGAWSAMNIVTLCAGGNHDVERDPDLWHSRGLVIRRGETDVDAWRRMADHGIHPR